jgi:hypothetical protein
MDSATKVMKGVAAAAQAAVQEVTDAATKSTELPKGNEPKPGDKA